MVLALLEELPETPLLFVRLKATAIVGTHAEFVMVCYELRRLLPSTVISEIKTRKG